MEYSYGEYIHINAGIWMFNYPSCAIKDAIVLPIAFECADSFRKSQEFRENVIQAFDELNVLVNLFDIIKNGISEGIKALE